MPEIRFTLRPAKRDERPTDSVPTPQPSRRFAISSSGPDGRNVHRRGTWRQRMVDAGRGLRLSLRMDGTMFAHLFIACCVLAAGFVLGLTAQQWAIVSLAITVVLAAETFNQMLWALWSGAPHHLPAAIRDVVSIGAAALLVTSIGAGAAIALVFADRLRS